MTRETRNFIAGHWQDGAATAENRNPSDLSDVIGAYAQADAAQLGTALDAARAAQPAWGATGPQKRHDVLMAIGTELMSRAEEIGTLIAREEGKPLAEGRGETYRAGQFFIGIDPAGFAGDAFGPAIDRLTQSITEQQGARLPGARRAANRARIEAEGVAVPQDLLDRIAAA